MAGNYYDVFREAFEGFENYYVLIGGTATTIVLDTAGLRGRATKDYDMVIIDENKDINFYNRLVQFLESGSYEETRRDDKAQLFRFVTKSEHYPQMIELFCVLPQFPLQKIGRVAPVSFEEGESLSAILLDKEYYDFLVRQKIVEKGYSVLSDKGLIVFKAKAWMDMRKRKAEGEGHLTNEIKKHLNDVVHLAVLLEPDVTLSQLTESEEIKSDMKAFIQNLISTDVALPKYRDLDEEPEEIIGILQNFLLN